MAQASDAAKVGDRFLSRPFALRHWLHDACKVGKLCHVLVVAFAAGQRGSRGEVTENACKPPPSNKACDRSRNRSGRLRRTIPRMSDVVDGIGCVAEGPRESGCSNDQRSDGASNGRPDRTFSPIDLPLHVVERALQIAGGKQLLPYSERPEFERPRVGVESRVEFARGAI